VIVGLFCELIVLFRVFMRCRVGPEKADRSLLSVDRSVLCVGVSLLSGVCLF